MKKILLFFLFAAHSGMKAQIAFDYTYNGAYNVSLNKFHVSGYKYVKVDIPNLKIELYNINNSLFKTVIIPPQSAPIQNISYISENLFDLDNQIEFALTTFSSSSAPPISLRYKFYVFKENGTQMMFRDSAYISLSSSDIFNNTDGVFFNGLNTKMRLSIQSSVAVTGISKTEIYTLAGSIPCAECSSTGTISGISSPGNPGSNNPVFYPNPVTDQLKLKYELPPDHKNAEIKIYDLQGKLIETFKVTNTFDFIYLPSDYNNGLYLYALSVDGKTIKTEKVILNK